MNTIASLCKKSVIPYVIYTHSPRSIYDSIHFAQYELSALKSYATINSLSTLDLAYDCLQSEALKLWCQNTVEKKDYPDLFLKGHAEKISSQGDLLESYKGKSVLGIPSGFFRRGLEPQILTALQNLDCLRYGQKNYAILSDNYRFIALTVHGGVYVDADAKTGSHFLREEILKFLDSANRKGFYSFFEKIEDAIKNAKIALRSRDSGAIKSSTQEFKTVKAYAVGLTEETERFLTVLQNNYPKVQPKARSQSDQITDWTNLLSRYSNQESERSLIPLKMFCAEALRSLKKMPEIFVFEYLRYAYSDDQKFKKLSPNLLQMAYPYQGSPGICGMLACSQERCSDLKDLIVSHLSKRPLLGSLNGNQWVLYRTFESLKYVFAHVETLQKELGDGVLKNAQISLVKKSKTDNILQASRFRQNIYSFVNNGKEILLQSRYANIQYAHLQSPLWQVRRYENVDSIESFPFDTYPSKKGSVLLYAPLGAEVLLGFTEQFQEHGHWTKPVASSSFSALF